MSSVLVSDDDLIRTVRMNRPEKKNALTLPMYEDMAQALEEANACADIRCLLIAGHESGFCAGSDIGDFATRAKSGGLAGPIIRFLYALARCEKPLVAAVAGRAVGVGTTLLLHCDYVVASDDAKLSTPFVALGLTPEAGSSLIAPRLIGHARAFELLVMGHALDAQAARGAGIVNAVVPAPELENAALAAAREIAALPPLAIKAARALMRGLPEEIVARIDEEAEIFRQRLTSAEAQAAFAAFLNRKSERG
jgi:enoyl-CoA hydratase/carnithine racemase